LLFIYQLIVQLHWSISKMHAVKHHHIKFYHPISSLQHHQHNQTLQKTTQILSFFKVDAYDKINKSGIWRAPLSLKMVAHHLSFIYQLFIQFCLKNLIFSWLLKVWSPEFIFDSYSFYCFKGCFHTHQFHYRGFHKYGNHFKRYHLSEYLGNILNWIPFILGVTKFLLNYKFLWQW